MDPTYPKTPSLPSDDSVPPDISDTQVFNHITQHLFECDEERAQALRQWIKHSGFEHILNVIGYLAVNPEKNIKDLGQYKYGNKTMDLKTYTRHQLKILAYWSREQTSTLQQCDISRSTWLTLTKTDYDHWRINADFTKLCLNQGWISSFRLAKREVLRLNNYISNLCLDDSWHGTTYQFLLHFRHQFHLLDNLVSMFDHIPDHSTRMTFLMKAIEKVPDSRQVNILSGAKTLCYESYFCLLLDAAYDHDRATRSPKSNQCKHTKQRGFRHDQDFDINNLSHREEMHHKIKRTNMKTQDSYSLPKISLPRALWSELTDNSRQVIIAYNKSTRNSSATACKKQTHSLDIDLEPDPDPDHIPIDDVIQDDSRDHQDDPSDLIAQFVTQVVTNIEINHPTSDLANLVSNTTATSVLATSIPNDCHKNNDCKQKVQISRHQLSRTSTFSDNNQMTGFNHWHLDPMQDMAPSSRTVENDGNPNDAFGKYNTRVVCNLNLLLDLPYDHGPDRPSFVTPPHGEYRSKPYLQDQNMAENRYQTVKRTTYVVTISGHIPLEILNGRPPGITHPLFFLIWDKAYSYTDSDAPSHRPYSPSFVTTLGYWLVFAPPIGDTLSLDTQTLCYSAILHDAPTPPNNLCVDTSSGEESLPSKPNGKQADIVFICSKGEDPSMQIPTIQHDDTIEQTFLVYDPEENGEQRQPQNGEQRQPSLIRRVVDLEQDALKQEECIKYTFCKSISNFDKIISYRQHMEYIKQDIQARATEDDVSQFRNFVTHRSSNNPGYKGSRCKILVVWETGEIYEPLSLMVNDAYAKKHDLLNELGWKHRKHFVKTSKVLAQAAKQQSRIKQDRHSVKVNKVYGQAHFNRGKTIIASPEEYHKNMIRIRLVKRIESRPALIITDEAFTKEPVEAIFLCTTSIHNFHTTTCLGILNDMDIWGAKVENAHDPEALSGEKILMVARQELKESGHILITHKASKGLKSSGAFWRDCFFDIAIDMDLSPTKADPNVWMKKAPGEHSAKGIDKTYQLKNDDYENIQETFSASIGNSRKYGPCSRSYSSEKETFRSMTRKITILTRRIVGSVRILTFN